MTTPKLFAPLALRGLTLRNRIVASPMCQYAAVDGSAQDWHYAHHARFALGGVGAAFVEATGVTPEGRITPACLGIWADKHIAAVAPIARLYRQHGVACGIQLAHAGRKGSAARPWDGAGPLPRDGAEPAWQTVAPSAIAVRPGWPAPRALEERELPAIVEAFRQAALRALAAGFDFVEIHGAHGYLIHSFLSPLSNQRTDAFGGSLENRMRLGLLVSEAVRAVWPDDRPLFYRTSAIDDAPGGITIGDTITLAKALKARGVDVVDCSSGGIIGSPLQAKPAAGFQIPLAAAVRAEAGVSTMAVGLITDPQLAEAALAEGRADLIALGRELLADSNWPHRAAIELGLPQPHQVLPHRFSLYLDRRDQLLQAASAAANVSGSSVRPFTHRTSARKT